MPPAELTDGRPSSMDDPTQASQTERSHATPVLSFAEMNDRLWGLPSVPVPRHLRKTEDTPDARFERDIAAAEAALPPAPDEFPGFFSRYLYTWMSPYLDLAYEERLDENNLPPPRRAHRARVCGARISAAFRDDEVLKGREAWTSSVATGRAVVFRDEPSVRGRLRWVGVLRASDDPRRLYAGVEWDATAPLPAYRVAILTKAAEADRAGVVHDGCVHGERLFTQQQSGAPRCTCERLEDIVFASEEGSQTTEKQTEKKPRTPSFFWVLVRAFKADVWSILPPAIYFNVGQLLNPILLQSFVAFLGSSRRTEGIVYGVVLVLLLTFQKITVPIAGKKDLHRTERLGCLVQSATMAAIFEKCLSISPAALADPEMSAGRILTMASSDVENLHAFARDFVYLFIAPFQLTFYVAYLGYLVGWSALAAVFAFAICFPAQSLVATVQGAIQERLSACIDRRLRRTNELLGGIRIVKTMGWESRFLHLIENQARAEEQRERRKLQITNCLSLLFVDSTTCLMATSIVFAYVLSGHTLVPTVAFPLISIIGSIGFPIMMLPEAITLLVQCLVSCRRIGRFLECHDQITTVRDVEEIFKPREESQPTNSSGTDDDDAAILFAKTNIFAWVSKKLNASPVQRITSEKGLLRWLHMIRDLVMRPRFPPELEWRDASAHTPPAGSQGEAEASPPDVVIDEGTNEKPKMPEGSSDDNSGAHVMVTKTLLKDMNLRIPRGKLTVIVGATGSGKSSVLNAVLGALGIEESRDDTNSGVWASRDLAYVPQQPWIMQDSIRANITFFEDVVSLERGQRLSASRLMSNEPLSVVCSPLWRRRTRRGRPIVPVPPTTEELLQRQRLEAAVRCCQLESDLSQLAHGLETEIGEKGVNLSGGQKARIGLARAVFSDRDVYLLDDPLSAVDVHVGRRLVKDVLLGALRHKTRVLVTHQVSVLPDADVVVVMRNGEVHFTGTYAEYAASSWRQVVEHDLSTEKENDPAAADGQDTVNEFSLAGSPVATRREDGETTSTGDRTFPQTGEAVSGDGEKSLGMDSASSDSDAWTSSEDDEPSVASRRKSGPSASKTGASQDGEDAAGKLIIEEEKETGHVPMWVYKGFIHAGGGLLHFFLITCLFVGNNILYLVWSLWLSFWSTLLLPDLSQAGYLAVYTLLCALLLCTHPFRNLFMFSFIRRACGRLHESLLYSVATAKVSFFDQTPLGRIVNRFSKDFYTLDDSMSMSVILVLEVVNVVAGSLTLTVISSPAILLFIAVAAVGFVYLLRYYTTIIREIRRRASIAQSPMFSLLEEITTGRESIDAYGKGHIIFDQALARLDKLYSAKYIEKMVTLWLTVRVEFLSAGVMISVAVAGLVEKASSTHDVLPPYRVSLLSLALAMSLELFWCAAACIEYFAIVEADMNSAQRVFHYIHTVPHEELLLAPPHGLLTGTHDKGDGDDQTHSQGKLSLAARGQRNVSVMVENEDTAALRTNAGALEFRHVDMRYRPGLPLVLRDVSFAISPNEKVGVVGRTGSGKSTLLQTFMQLVEVSAGTMLVDGVPAARMTLPTLRKRFAMIPQDPVLFEGTVRSNLDPFGESSDAEVRRALRLVGLAPSSSDAQEGTTGGDERPHPHTGEHQPSLPPPQQQQHAVALDAAVTEGGKNFSVGQRQLLCLARALLKKGSAFILMDEATANIDPALDRQVQTVVREQFRDFTVITIAHRLHTVAGYDRVFVMEQGRLAEAGSPRALVQDRHSMFRRMVVQAATRQKKTESPAEDGAETGTEGDSHVVASPTTARERREAAAVEAFLAQCDA